MSYPDAVARNANYRGVNEQGEDIYADGFYSASRNTIFVNSEASRTQERLLIHELDHAIRKDMNSKFGIRNSEFEATKKKIDENYDKSERNAEYFAFYSEKMLTNKHTLEKLIEAEPTLKEKILNFFKGASQDYADVPKLSGAAKKYYRTYKKLFDDFSARNSEAFVNEKSLTSINQGNMQVSDRQYSLRVKKTDGTERLVNPYQTTRDETLEYMKMARKGKLQNYTYFPVSSNTPKTIINSLREAGVIIEDRPLAMQADKARQSQIIGKPFKKNGFTIRYHAMEAEKIVEVIESLDNATTIIQQQNRTAVKEIDGKKKVVDLPDNYAVFVTLSDGKEYVAIIEVDAKINEDFIVRDGKGEKYHTTVTVFEPDVTRNGQPFDYIEYLLSRDGNRELDIMKENPNLEDANRQTEATTSKKEFSDNSIPENQKNVKGIDENSSNRQNALPLDEDGISGAEVLSWFENKPKGDGKIDLEATVARGLPYRRGKSNLTVGELRKVIANSTHDKVYSKKDALRVVNKFSGSSGLTVKAREEIADTIWQFLNEAIGDFCKSENSVRKSP